MLGIFLGSTEFVSDFVKAKLLSRLDSTMQKLIEFEDSQAVMFLLRISFGIVRGFISCGRLPTGATKPCPSTPRFVIRPRLSLAAQCRIVRTPRLA